ncbi:MAG: RAD55 family ATPase [Thermoplasmata archaeon]
MTPPLLDRLPEFCSILLSGPPGVGKFEFLMGALTKYLADGLPVVFVCIDIGPGELQAYLRRSGFEPSEVLGRDLSVIDGFSAAVSEEAGEEREGIRVVSSLSNLEGLGMAITERAADHGRPVRILFYTISTLFLHNSARSLSKFFQIVSARVKTQLGTILYASQEGVTEERQENLLRALVDGVIDMRFNGSFQREVMFHHLRGHRIVPEWIPLPEEGHGATQVTSNLRNPEREGGNT